MLEGQGMGGWICAFSGEGGYGPGRCDFSKEWLGTGLVGSMGRLVQRGMGLAVYAIRGQTSSRRDGRDFWSLGLRGGVFWHPMWGIPSGG